VELSDGGALDYDWLIVATGSKHAYFGHSDWEPNAPGLKTLEDAIGIRRRILIAFERAEREEDTRRQHELLTFVIVGGGPTGVELAGTLADGPDEVVKAVRTNFKNGADFIKILATGAVLSKGIPPGAQQYSDEELAAIVDERLENTA